MGTTQIFLQSKLVRCFSSKLVCNCCSVIWLQDVKGSVLSRLNHLKLADSLDFVARCLPEWILLAFMSTVGSAELLLAHSPSSLLSKLNLIMYRNHSEVPP